MDQIGAQLAPQRRLQADDGTAPPLCLNMGWGIGIGNLQPVQWMKTLGLDIAEAAREPEVDGYALRTNKTRSAHPEEPAHAV